MATTPHKLFGYRDGTQPCSAAAWAQDAKQEIEAAWHSQSLPVLVGGTGLYLQTLLNGIAPVPAVDPTVRAAVRAMDLGDAYKQLMSVDPHKAARLLPSDSQRIRRALEVQISSGQTLSHWQKLEAGGIAGKVELHPLLLLPPRDWLHARCDARFEAMLDRGAIDEVVELLDLNLPDDAPVMRAIGVPEIRAMLNGELSREEALTRGQAATRQYAKRQYTWFRNQSPPEWPRWIMDINCAKNSDIVTLFQLL